MTKQAGEKSFSPLLIHTEVKNYEYNKRNAR